WHTLFFGHLGGSVLYREWQTCEIIFMIDHKHALVFIRQHILTKLRKQSCEFLIDLRESLLLIFVKFGALPHKVCIVKPNQTLLFRRQLFFFLRVVNGFYSRKELFVLIYLVGECSESRRHFLLHFSEIRRAHGRAPYAVDGADPVEGFATAFHGRNGVLKRRRLG